MSFNLYLLSSDSGLFFYLKKKNPTLSLLSCIFIASQKKKSCIFISLNIKNEVAFFNEEKKKKHEKDTEDCKWKITVISAISKLNYVFLLLFLSTNLEGGKRPLKLLFWTNIA